MDDSEQPKPDSKKYSELINDIERGVIKIPKFQREFVWNIDMTAKLLDSILKGYPIGTFILWETDERMNNVKNIGGFRLPETPEGTKIQYVLDGQQRIASLFAAYKGAEIQKTGEKKVTDYKAIVVNLDKDINEGDDQVITAGPTGGKHISLAKVLKFTYSDGKKLEEEGEFSGSEMSLIDKYSQTFKTYVFSTIVLRKEDIDSAIEVFTRINTSGKTLTLFEIMSAKTYDEKQKFDMQSKWEKLIENLQASNYETISSTVVLSLLALVLSDSKECKRKTILALDKQLIINEWEGAISALEHSIDYFRTVYQIPVSHLLPYDLLLVPFAYFFFRTKEENPNTDQKKWLEEFFWRMSLSHRYSAATESRLAQDIKRIDQILDNQRPDYSGITVELESPQSLIDTDFSTGNSYCKAVLCLLAYKAPKDFQDNRKVILDNSWLKISSSKNYHHFFPKKFLEKNKIGNSNSLVNITLVSDNLNKRKIGAKPPSVYIGEFGQKNSDIKKALKSHLLDKDDFGIEDDNYDKFLKARAERIYKKLKKRIAAE